MVQSKYLKSRTRYAKAVKALMYNLNLNLLSNESNKIFTAFKKCNQELWVQKVVVKC